MQCPRCGLYNHPSAQRCDCGYDFQTHTVENPYYTEKLPNTARTLLVIVTVWTMAILLVAPFMPGVLPGRIAAAVATCAVGWILYGQVLQGKNWARIALGLVFWPAALVLWGREAKMYCMQKAARDAAGGRGITEDPADNRLREAQPEVASPVAVRDGAGAPSLDTPEAQEAASAPEAPAPGVPVQPAAHAPEPEAPAPEPGEAGSGETNRLPTSGQLSNYYGALTRRMLTSSTPKVRRGRCPVIGPYCLGMPSLQLQGLTGLSALELQALNPTPWWEDERIYRAPSPFCR